MTDEFPKITLKAARIDAGYTQDGAAHAIGKTKQTIVNWEKRHNRDKVEGPCDIERVVSDAAGVSENA